MRCQVCGEEADVHYKVDSDGVEKEIAYCRRCLTKVLKNPLELNDKGLSLMTAYENIVQDSPAVVNFTLKSDFIDVFVKMPVSVLMILFRDDGTSDERRKKEIYTREMAILQKRLESAVKKEDYRKANEIKKKIQTLKRILERK